MSQPLKTLRLKLIETDSDMQLLLFSNSTNAGEEYMSYTLPYIREFMTFRPENALFIPYAGINISYDDYSAMVSLKFKETGIEITSIHQLNDKKEALQNSDLIIVGGGNTFHLLYQLQYQELLAVIREKVLSGTPYIGWSAGSNITCPTIMTTNDMPVIEPQNFKALNLIPFQINPHYTDTNPAGHAGETREMRLNEFIVINKSIYVAGLREGTLFHVDNNRLHLKGNKSCRILRYGQDPMELDSSHDFSFLLQ